MYSWGPDKGVASLRIGVTNTCEPLGGYWKLNLGPVQEQQVLLPTKASYCLAIHSSPRSVR